MSVVNQSCRKILLPRAPYRFWNTIRDLYPRDHETWRGLAMLALREDAQWSFTRIARAFEITPLEVEECLDRVKQDLRRRLERIESHAAGARDPPDEPR